jgi:proteasome lid subunit RPN8/RPN11
MTDRIDLLAARRFVLPHPLATMCMDAIIERGNEGAELFVALAATVGDDGATVQFRRGVIPRQTAYTTADGLLVKIDGEALYELNRDCREHGDIVAGQLHSHPERAYHSAADDELAIVQLPGGLSIVVPHFGRGGVDAADTWSVHQLTPDGEWDRPGDGVELIFS